VGGDYRYVRNPMYLAVIGAVLGQALLFASLPLLGYGLGLWAVMAAFVHWYEEPALRRQHGTAYAAYCAEVRAWLPRGTPWHG
jgi:protein-S-isoprenylcysteine O-methyltransferase Ste14